MTRSVSIPVNTYRAIRRQSQGSGFYARLAFQYRFMKLEELNHDCGLYLLFLGRDGRTASMNLPRPANLRQARMDAVDSVRARLTRWIVLDGEYHVERDCCSPDGGLGKVCGKCGGRVHTQPVYAGLAEACEGCDTDWQQGPPPKPAGAFT